MNEKRLNTIFENYMAKFDYITYSPHEEIYKWEIAHDFKLLMDVALSSPPKVFLEKIKQIVSLAGNLLSNQYELPGGAICAYIEKDIENGTDHMRQLLSELLSDDNGDLEVRQQRIDRFATECNKLKTRYFPNSYKYEIGQRAVMVLLGLYDPENNYLYKPMQANEFADCVEFYDDFGPSTHFKLSVYYRMCDELVKAIRSNTELMAKHNGIYDNPKKPLHEDKNLHIFAFDIIYAGTTYHLYNNIEYGHITNKERKEYLINCEKAEELADEVDRARAELDLYHEAIEVYSKMLSVGKKVTHKKWGAGTITQYKRTPSGDTIRVCFAACPEEKPFEAAKSVLNGYLVPDVDGLQEINMKYKSIIIKGGYQLQSALKKAETAFMPYEKYLS